MKSWMKDENLPDYWDLMHDEYYQAAHQMTKSSFNTYAHHLAGRSYLLHMLVKLPILPQCSTAKSNLIELPALKKWIDDLQRHKTTDEYKKAVQKSQPAATPNHCRLPS